MKGKGREGNACDVFAISRLDIGFYEECERELGRRRVAVKVDSTDYFLIANRSHTQFKSSKDAGLM